MKQALQLEMMARRAHELCEQTKMTADEWDVDVHLIGGATVLDFGSQRVGSRSGGIRLAEICLAGMAHVGYIPSCGAQLPLPAVTVSTDWPVVACIAAQYAGWAFSHGDYFAMCSGPARVNRGTEEILAAFSLTGDFSPAIGIFETSQLPGEAEIDAFAQACRVNTEEVILCIARTASFPGTTQVVARSVETTLHKLHELKFELSTIRAAMGTAPLPPIPTDDLVALGWTNDSILYGGLVNLWVDTTDEAIADVLDHLPSSSSSDFGEPFLQTFQRYGYDFYKIDKHLFSPARVVFNNLRTGRVFDCGKIRIDILKHSFGIEN